VGIGAQRALMVLMAYWLSRMFSGYSQFSVGPFSDNVGLTALLFSDNLDTKQRCSRAERFMFSRHYNYTPDGDHVKSAGLGGIFGSSEFIFIPDA